MRLRVETFLAVLFVCRIQRGVAAGVEGGAALGLHGRGEAVLEDSLALCLINSCAVLGEGGHYTGGAPLITFPPSRPTDLA